VIQEVRPAELQSRVHARLTTDEDLLSEDRPDDRQLVTPQKVQQVGSIDEQRRRADFGSRWIEEPETRVPVAVSPTDPGADTTTLLPSPVPSTGATRRAQSKEPFTICVIRFSKLGVSPVSTTSTTSSPDGSTMWRWHVFARVGRFAMRCSRKRIGSHSRSTGPSGCRGTPSCHEPLGL